VYHCKINADNVASSLHSESNKIKLIHAVKDLYYIIIIIIILNLKLLKFNERKHNIID